LPDAEDGWIGSRFIGLVQPDRPSGFDLSNMPAIRQRYLPTVDQRDAFMQKDQSEQQTADQQ
jgi:hypothetical protein